MKIYRKSCFYCFGVRINKKNSPVEKRQLKLKNPTNLGFQTQLTLDPTNQWTDCQLAAILLNTRRASCLYVDSGWSLSVHSLSFIRERSMLKTNGEFHTCLNLLELSKQVQCKQIINEGFDNFKPIYIQRQLSFIVPIVRKTYTRTLNTS